MATGSCLCGNVTYGFPTPVKGIIHCHCTTCRKAHGSAFSSVASVPAADFKLTGAEHLGSFESSHGKHRYFCSNCGTQVYAQRDGKKHVIVRLGSLDTPLDANEFAHTWMSHSVDWFDLDGNLPRYAEEMRDFAQGADVEYDIFSKKWRLIARRLLPVAFMFAMPFVGFAAGSGAVAENLFLATILLILTASVVDACWYFYKHPIRLRLTSSSLVASGLFFQKEYPLTCIVGFYVPPYCGSGYFEISHMLDGTVDSMKVFDAAGRDVFRRALGERAPWVKCLGA